MLFICVCLCPSVANFLFLQWSHLWAQQTVHIRGIEQLFMGDSFDESQQGAADGILHVVPDRIGQNQRTPYQERRPDAQQIFVAGKVKVDPSE